MVSSNASFDPKLMLKAIERSRMVVSTVDNFLIKLLRALSGSRKAKPSEGCMPIPAMTKDNNEMRQDLRHWRA
eukprot:CAMPEP_0117027404 /NCGR_PEP_ID=MMETSP0472-20121206/20038_1 /TAXON_ID=693140 ORGANISM="Tiarina fusus, Strain LIS" /NCGR_SAMPLE_ID=MMETSP0472 /ASSEMBLY_ACC=CAM_ASM_000603 /LENGTH=72 /DNA_ID=CAMNT_0004734647 /DNA_START=246 /DNA_END=464 /DNA_ORIENTATION=+